MSYIRKKINNSDNVEFHKFIQFEKLEITQVMHCIIG